MAYYKTDSTTKQLVEISEEEFNTIRETYKEKSSYAEKVYSGELALTDAPEEYRTWIQGWINRKNGITTSTKAQAYDILTGVSE